VLQPQQPLRLTNRNEEQNHNLSVREPFLTGFFMLPLNHRKLQNREIASLNSNLLLRTAILNSKSGIIAPWMWMFVFRCGIIRDYKGEFDDFRMIRGEKKPD